MRRCVGAVLFVWILLLCPNIVSADLVGTGQIMLQGTVPPLRNVIVNNQDQITEITSNSTADIQPTVYRNKILTIDIISISPKVSQEYKMLSQKYNLNRVGIVFLYSTTTSTIKNSRPLILPVISWHKYDDLISYVFNNKFLHFFTF